MHKLLTPLLSKIETAQNMETIQELAKRLIPLSVSYQMAGLSIDDAVLNFEDLNKRECTEDEKEALSFGFLAGINTE
jgi:hypothetical protein